MYLFEVKNLSKKADKANLEWTTGISAPIRDKKEIALPLDRRASYFPLQEGRQFLFRQNNRAWFGGTDEEPFLVELEQAVANKFIEFEGLENKFYNLLVPNEVFNLSDETSNKYKRQGDIFAVRFCGESYFEKRLASLLKTEVKSGEFNVLRTRHIGKGITISIGNSTTGMSQLFKGRLEAPDHRPLLLEDGLYLLGQTKYIVNPTNAD